MAITDRIDTLRSRIDGSDAIGDRDAETLRTFDERLTLHAQTYSDHRHEKLLRHGVLMAERLDAGTLTDALSDRDTAEAVVAWVNAEFDNEETNRDYRVALRILGKRVAESREIETNSDAVPEALAWVPTGTSSNYDTTPDPRDMLRKEEHIDPMIDAAQNPRDAAMIALQFDAGLRGGEFKSLSVGDVQDHEYGLEVTVDGKQGRRTVTLVLYPSIVVRWLDLHPVPEDRDAPLWSKLNRAAPISDTMVGKVFNELADRADVDRNVTLTRLRKSRAAFLASRNMNQAHLEDHHGWVRGSDAAARYISVFGESTDRELARAHGIDVSDDEPEAVAPQDCPRCDRQTPSNRAFCIHCGQALDAESTQLVDEVTSGFEERAVSLEDPDRRADAIEAARTVREEAGRMGKDELHSLASDLSDSD